jgi:WD40 repeat protein
MIVSASDDGTLKVWDGSSGVERIALRGHARKVSRCAVSADGAIIVSALVDGKLTVWDGHSGAERFTLSGHADGVRGLRGERGWADDRVGFIRIRR